MQLSTEPPARAGTGRCDAGCYFRSQGKILFSSVTDKLIFCFINSLLLKYEINNRFFCCFAVMALLLFSVYIRVWVAAIRATVSPGSSMAHPPCVNPYGLRGNGRCGLFRPSMLSVILVVCSLLSCWVKTLALL